MPVKLERSLKRKVAGKNWSEERKDAYVYGTLRKTGWKPSTQKKEKKMSAQDRVIKLSQINKNLDSVIKFDRYQYDDDDPTLAGKTATVAGETAAAGTAGAAGLYGLGKLAPTRLGGQGLSPLGAAHDVGYGVRPIARGIAQGAGVVKGAVGGAFKSGLGSAKDLLRRAALRSASFLASAKYERLVELNQKLDGVVEFAGNPKDPGAGMFGGSDPGTFARIAKNNAENSALQRLRLKIARLKAMGLHY